MNRVYNFNAGPSAMPLEVLREVQEEFLDFNHTGMSVVEISHRSAAYQAMQDETETLLKELLHIPDGYHVIFMQGGGSMQFILHAQNFLRHKGAYVKTGSWSSKAQEAAKFYGATYELASGEAQNYKAIPLLIKDTVDLQPDTDYVYITSNETIHGLEWKTFPKLGVPLICDMSSDFLSRPVDVSQFDFIYAGIQKNVGPAGCVIAIVKDEFLEKARTDIPPYLQYATFVKKDSTYNTPPVFCIYFVNKVLHWLKNLGGLDVMEARNKKKAKLIYDVIDNSQGFYIGHAEKNSRSLMNVTFNLQTPELEKRFAEEATKADLIGLKGHRSVGGCRASLYNAVTPEGCEALVDFMQRFQTLHS